VFLVVSHPHGPPHPIRRGPSIPHFWDPTYAQRFDLQRRNLITHVGRSLFLWGSTASPTQEGGLQHPQIFVTSYMRAHSMRNNNQISHGDQTIDVRQALHGRQRMLTRDLFAVANLLVHFLLSSIISIISSVTKGFRTPSLVVYPTVCSAALTRICAAEMAVRYAALCTCRKVHT